MVNQIASNMGEGGMPGGIPDFSSKFAHHAPHRKLQTGCAGARLCLALGRHGAESFERERERPTARETAAAAVYPSTAEKCLLFFYQWLEAFGPCRMSSDGHMFKKKVE